MDDQQFPQAPHCDWEQFCRELPGMLHQMHGLADAVHRMEGRIVGMDRRDESMAVNLAALHQNQLVLHSQLESQGRQVRQIVDGVCNLTGSPSNFQTLTSELKGSVGLTKRIWRLLAAGIAAIVALWGVTHLSVSKGEPADTTSSEPAPRGDL